MKYKLNLETLPIFALVALYLLFIIFFSASTVFGIFGPSPFVTVRYDMPAIPDEDFYSFMVI